MFFDGSRSQEGVREGCILIDPEQHKTLISYHLDFECTNNTIEYEALVQGLKKSIDLKVKCLRVFGDSEIVV
jgi:ribonuclease HI